MSPPKTTKAGPRPETGPVQTTTNAPQDSGPQQVVRGLPIVTGTELLPIGGARYSKVTVPHAACGHVHTHLLFETTARSIVRSPQCSPHTEYRIEIVDVVPAAQQRRQRGAA